MVELKTPSATWVIEAEGLTKSFGNRHALRGVTFQVREGDRLVIFGPNGAGKTTLMNILSTVAKPASGTVRINGQDASRNVVPVKSQIGLVGHQTFLYDELTIHENLVFYGKMYDVTDLQQRVREVAGIIGLESRLHDRVGTLSRGMCQRVSIARAVIHNPPILLLDEPEVGLDFRARTMMMEIVKLFDLGARTVIMTTHNLDQGIEMGNRVAILSKGELVYQATSEEISGKDFSDIYAGYTE